MSAAASSALVATASLAAVAAVGLACLLLLGLRWRRLRPGYRIALLLLALSAIAWAAVRYAIA